MGRTPISPLAAAGVYIRIGLLSFGGPAGQIALMQDEIVERRGWISEEDFARGLSVAMVLPGPEAHQLATWLGWRLHGLRGGILAGLSFILPGALVMLALAYVAASQGKVPLVAALFYGIQPAVLVIVARAAATLARRALTGWAKGLIAGAAFVGIYLLSLPFPLIIASAALAGALFLRTGPTPGLEDTHVPPGHLRRTLIPWSAGILVLWATLRLTLGPEPFDGIAALFTSAAFVSFGGAYALLPYVADQAVETYGWLSAAEMLNGLALAEATPGPLILVNTYAGFFAGWSGPGSAGTGLVTGALATVYTFAPSFMLILAAAPYVGQLDRRPVLRRALAGVSAAVVGVIANLALYLAEASLFPSGAGVPEWPKLALLLSFTALAMWRALPMHWLVALGACAGLLFHAFGVI